MTQYGQYVYGVLLVPVPNSPDLFETGPVQPQTMAVVDHDDGSGDNLQVLQSGETFDVLADGTLLTLTYAGSASGGFVAELDGQYIFFTPTLPSEGATISWDAADYVLPENDLVAPGLDAVTGSGNTVTLIFDEPIDPSSTPSPSSFGIMLPDSGAMGNVTSISISGSTVVLTIDISIGDNTNYFVAYDPSRTSSPIRDMDGNAATSFSLLVEDSVPPTLLSVSAGADHLLLTFDEVLRSSLPATGDFEILIVAADGSTTPVAVADVYPGLSADQIYLDLAGPLAGAESLRIIYTPGSSPIGDTAGNNASAFEQTFDYATELPAQENNAGGALSGATTLVITGDMLRYADLQDGPEGVTYRLFAIPDAGRLSVDGIPLAMGDSFTQADIEAGLVVYDVISDALPIHGFRFIVSDSDGNSLGEQLFEISYEAANAAPYFGSDSGGGQNGLDGAVDLIEGEGAILLDGDVEINDPNLHLFSGLDYAGTSLTLSRLDGASADDSFGFAASSAFSIEGDELVGTALTGHAVVSQSSGTLLITFDGIGTSKEFVDAVMRSITYENTAGEPPSTVTVGWTFSDGNTGAQGPGGEETATGTTTVSFHSADDGTDPASGITLSSHVVQEDSAPSTVVGQFSDVTGGPDEPTAYTLVQGPGDSGNALFEIVGAQLRVASGAQIEFGDALTHLIRVRATYADGSSREEILRISVANVNDAPEVGTAIGFVIVDQHTPFSRQIAADAFVDADADPLVLEATLADGSALPDWLSFDPATRTFSGFTTEVEEIELRITATDPSGASISQNVALVVRSVVSFPTLASPIDDQTAVEDQSFSFQFAEDTFTNSNHFFPQLNYAATLGDGSALPSWLVFDAATRTFSGMPGESDAGQLTIRVTATDMGGAVAFDTFTLTVGGVNDGPVLAHPIADQTATEDEAFTFRFDADAFADIDAGDTLSYAAALGDGSAPPSWLVFDAATRTFSGMPGESDAGQLTIRVTATDRAGASVSDTFTLTVGGVNDGPVLAHPIADQTATEDEAFTFRFDADAFADVDAGDTLSYAAALGDGSTLPSWLVFDTATRTFSGMPGESDAGQLTIRVTATDMGGAVAFDTFTLTVGGVNDGPVLAHPIADQTATEDEAFTFRFDADAFADIDAGDTLSYAAALGDGSALPSWLVFDAATRTFSGIPGETDAGQLTIRVTATDRAGASVSDTFTLTVGGVNDGPVLVSPHEDQAVAIGDLLRLSIGDGYFRDPDHPDLRYSISVNDGAAPGWMTFDAETGTLTITPGVGEAGDYVITVTATDGLLSASSSFDLLVTPPEEAEMFLSGAGVAEDERAGSVVGTLSGWDADGEALTSFRLKGDSPFRVVGDELKVWEPEKLDFESRSSYKISVIAKESDGDRVEQQFTIRVIDVKESPRGTPRNDILVGDALDNRLGSKGGNDRLTGGDGADIFVFGRDYGRDKVMDFDFGEGDRIDLTDAAGIKGFDDLVTHHLRGTAPDVKIIAQDESVLVIANVEAEALTEEMFIF